MPGEGKNMVCHYIINYAERVNETTKGNLIVTKFDSDSSWKNGSVLKLKSQFDQFANENKLFLIFEDEVSKLLRERGGVNDQDKEDVVLEFQSFLDGAYLNKGNYLIIATTNKYTDLPAAIRRRFEVKSWKVQRIQTRNRICTN